jgi:hypothetical protein
MFNADKLHDEDFDLWLMYQWSHNKRFDGHFPPWAPEGYKKKEVELRKRLEKMLGGDLK